jgi:hypothetical protein
VLEAVFDALGPLSRSTCAPGGCGEEVEVTSRLTQQFEFRVCQVQRGRVTIVNGEWIGTGKMDPNRAEAALASCPWEWDYLGQAGRDGRDLVAVIQTAGAEVRMVYLRRER